MWVAINRDGAWFDGRNASTWGDALAAAAELSGYSIQTVRDYVYGRRQDWTQPGDGYVLPVKSERHRDGVAVWIFHDDEVPAA